MNKEKKWYLSNKKHMIPIPASDISYADKPLCLNPKIVPLAENIQEKLQFFHKEYTAFDTEQIPIISLDFNKHTHELSKAIKKQCVTLDIEDIKDQAEQLLNGKPLAIKFVICDLDNVSNAASNDTKPIKVGHGLFVKSKVQQGQLLGIYSGTIEAVNKNLPFANDLGIKVTPNHCLNVSDRGAMTFIQSGPNKDLGRIEDLLNQLSALQALTGGIEMSFLETSYQKQRILRQNEWQLLDAKASRKDAIAGENCLPIPIMAKFKGDEIPLIAMVAKKDLAENTQLLFDYGYEYFDALKIYPEYFLTNKEEGLIFKHNEYLRPSYGVLRFADLSYCPIGDWTIFFDQTCEKEVSIQFQDAVLNLTGEQLRKELVRANMIRS